MKLYKNNSLTKQSDIEIYEKRIRTKNLKWVDQIIKILDKKFLFKKTKKKYFLNDLGCNLFQFYKGLKSFKLEKKIIYKGYDHDITYLNLGLKHFPELKKKYKIFNFEKSIPTSSDISIISATLEHLNYPDQAISNILKSTKKVVIIRSFFGKNKIKKLFKNKKYIDNPYYINQFTFNWLKAKLRKFNFKISKIIKDKATNGKIRKIYPNIKRKFYIIVATKNEIKF